MGRQNKEEHHIIPISLQGPNWKENVIILPKEDHKLLHDILDIPYGWLRRFRKRTNALVYMDVFYVQQLIMLHKLYFARFPNLPQHLQYQHVKSIELITKRSMAEYDVYYKIQAVELRSSNATFHFWMEHYHNVLMNVAVRFEEQLPPQNHPKIIH